MGGPFSSYSFSLPKPLLHLLHLLRIITFAFSPPPPPPPPPPQTPAPSTSSRIKTILPVADFARLAGDSPPPACVVCLAGFAPTDQVRDLLNCRHVFHRGCIDRWIDADGLTCPLCRSPLLPSPEQEEGEEREDGGLITKMLRRIRNIPLSIHSFINNLYVDNYL